MAISTTSLCLLRNCRGLQLHSLLCFFTNKGQLEYTAFGFFIYFCFGLGLVSDKTRFSNASHCFAVGIDEFGLCASPQSFFWRFTSVVVLLPLLNHQIEFDRATWLLWLQMVFWTIATMIPFEIRDINHDSESMKTIPHTFGIRGAKMIASLMLFGVAVLSYLLSLEYDDMVPTLIASILALVFLWKSTLHQSTYFASFWVEALPMAWLLSAVVWKWI